MKCEQCGKEHDGTFGSGRFCCRSCSNKYVALHQSPEAKARKVAKGAKNLSLRKSNHVFTEEDRLRGIEPRKEVMKSRRYEWLQRVLSNEQPAWGGSYQRFRERLIEFGYKEHKCESCGLSTWLGKPIPLAVHHIDRDSPDNSLSNIQLLCFNCHALTDNYGWRVHNSRKSRS